MSKLFENEYGVFISHKSYIDILYKNVNSKQLQLNPNLFRIGSQYNSNKNARNKDEHFEEKYKVLLKEQEEIKSKFNHFMDDFLHLNILIHQELTHKNKDALETAEFVYNESGEALIGSAYGANIGPATIKNINNYNFIFPENSVFFSKDVQEIQNHLDGETYDVILLDPPWWNKYIRRKRKKSGDGYQMIFNNDLKNLPIGKLLKNNGMVVVWCTNSPQHLNYLANEIFPEWNVTFVGKWYWLKVTTAGKPVCNFSLPPGKQPFEQIIFGSRAGRIPSFTSKLVISVPSAIHSHKPPLAELLKDFLPDDPSCLEIFARYLLPGWTSYGNEVLRLQHESLFVTV